MKKNKTIAYMLAATLLVGGTFAGTKALFTSEDVSTNDIIISMGNLKTKINGNWLVKTNNTESIMTENIIQNLKPGDRLYKEMTIENTGTLDQTLSFTGGDLTELGASKNDNLTIITAERGMQALEGKILAPGEKQVIAVAITIEEQMENKNMDVSFDLSKYINPITVKGTQTSAYKQPGN